MECNPLTFIFQVSGYSHLSCLLDGVCSSVKHQRRHDEADDDVDHVEHEPGDEEDPLAGPGPDPHPDVSNQEHQQPGGEAFGINVGQDVVREYHEAEVDGNAQDGQDEDTYDGMYCLDFWDFIMVGHLPEGRSLNPQQHVWRWKQQHILLLLCFLHFHDYCRLVLGEN